MEADKNRLHIDDNTSVLLHQNSEKDFIDFWLTQAMPSTRVLNLAVVHSVVTETYSPTFYRQYEALCDGIIDVRSREEAGKIEHFMRVRAMRGKQHDSRWRRLRLRANGEVGSEPVSGKNVELGIHDWLKGPSK